jgi:hypothetical protein
MFGTFKAVESDVKVAKCREEESVMDSDAVSQQTLYFGKNRAAHNGSHQ